MRALLFLPLLLSAQSSEFLFEPLPSHPRCHAVTAVELPNGDLYAAWFAGRNEGSPDQAIFFSRRTNNAWSRPKILIDTPNVADFNPVLLSAPDALHLFYVLAATGIDPNSSLWHLTSSDHGVTWSAPARLSPGDSHLRPSVDGGDCPPTAKGGFWGRNAPIRSQSRWLIPVSDVQARGARALVSTDLKTFTLTPLLTAEPHISQPALAPLAGTGVAAVIRQRTRPNGRIWFASSPDNGGTWTKPAPLDLPNNDSGVALLTLPSNRLLLVYNHTPSGRTPLNTAWSDDNGRTWTPGPVLENTPGEFSYPTALLARDGRVHIFYTWKRTHIRHFTAPPAWFTTKP